MRLSLNNCRPPFLALVIHIQMQVFTHLIVLVTSVSAQLTVQGTVHDRDTDEPIISANVLLERTGRGAATDVEGHFRIENVAPGSYTLTLTAMGYEPHEASIQVGEDNLELSFSLIRAVVRMPALTVLSERMSLVGGAGNLFRVPGSAAIISKRELERYNYGNIHQILRQVPGINIQEEDGFGLRPNIGMRGTGVERSRKISLMEDGVLISPAPYSAPSAYYFPAPGRMESVEIRKGSSQIQYGPNTNGGVLNMVSTSIPDEFAARVKFIGGSYGQLRAHLNAGASVGNFGFLVETYQDENHGFKKLQGGGNTGYNKKDYLAKLRVRTSQDFVIPMAVQFKWNTTDELSNETYLGLADNDFQNSPLTRYRASQKDQMNAEHRQLQVSHVMQPMKNLDITTTWYENVFSRNWYKLDRVRGEKIGSILNDPARYAEAFDLLSASESDSGEYQIKANNRQYASSGIQSVGRLKMGLGRMSHELEFGIRFHQDYEDRFQWLDKYQMVGGRLEQTYAAIEGSEDNRKSSAGATAVFFQDEITLSNITVSAGVRGETIGYEKQDWGRSDLHRQTDGNPHKTHVRVLLPGAGVHYRLNPTLSLLGGMYKGFTPPGPRKESEKHRAEESVNTEFGFRYQKGLTQAQAIAFVNRYDNLLGADLLAIGGEGTGDQYNGGKVDINGLELIGAFAWILNDIRIRMMVTYTFTEAKFKKSFKSDYKPWGNVRERDELPYLPNHQGYLRIGLESGKWNGSLSARYADAMRTKAGQGKLDPQEYTDAHAVFDFSGEYAVNDISRFFVTIQNLTNATYIAARRPAGVRPGLPRTVMVGMKLEF